MAIISQEQLIDGISKALSAEFNKKRNFLQSIELILTLKGIDIKKGEIKLREAVVLPKKPSKEFKVLVVPSTEIVEEAKKAQPNLILTREELQKLQGNKRQIKKIASKNDWFLISPDIIAVVGKILGPALGPRGKFPLPLPTGGDIVSYISRYKRATLVRIKDQPHIQTFIGTEDMKVEDLVENAEAVLNVIEQKLPSLSLIKYIYIKTTMGKPVQIKVR
jgi:large subunit ribosomal protein L1